jgi:hypothetical protein
MDSKWSKTEYPKFMENDRDKMVITDAGWVKRTIKTDNLGNRRVIDELIIAIGDAEAMDNDEFDFSDGTQFLDGTGLI